MVKFTSLGHALETNVFKSLGLQEIPTKWTSIASSRHAAGNERTIAATTRWSSYELRQRNDGILNENYEERWTERRGKLGWFARWPDLKQFVLHYLYRALRWSKQLIYNQQMHYFIIYTYNLLHIACMFRRYYLAIFRQLIQKVL